MIQPDQVTAKTTETIHFVPWLLIRLKSCGNSDMSASSLQDTIMAAGSLIVSVSTILMS